MGLIAVLELESRTTEALQIEVLSDSTQEDSWQALVVTAFVSKSGVERCIEQSTVAGSLPTQRSRRHHPGNFGPQKIGPIGRWLLIRRWLVAIGQLRRVVVLV